MSEAQELPRKGGYPNISYTRRLPKKGPTGIVMLAGVASIMAYGWYNVFNGIRERRELEREKMWGRIYLLPLLTAETDRDEYRRYLAATEREKDIMKNVSGWPAGKSVYNTDRYITPTIPNIPESQRN
ncbi:NADH dehydrogenase [ubiquinone] 1 alpha subcomplex subunit 13 [Smittium mucronatum]|uniref:NADH dehydrogenase [ubiquinone] 1 alpha subcomplex subunit 13 n=1 Tax=Smittium mucronatum TaxID=133383 RepID=A0A1R0GZ74_9FUNG|nr:NADH dehydrogenase [ubiquinone] 1 alpha subcomplex subunit 13 [Smittium mucronatum]